MGRVGAKGPREIGRAKRVGTYGAPTLLDFISR